MSNKNILLIEDDTDIRRILKMSLEGEGYFVMEAIHGKEALDLLRTHTTPRPSVVFLDLMMPVMDGKTFLSEIEKDPSLSDLPIIVLTAAAERIQNKVAGLISKPLSIEKILQVVQKYCPQT